MSVRPNDLSHLDPTGSGNAKKFDPNEIIEAIVKVRQDNYVPPTVKLRARVDATMFTCELSAGALKQVEADPNVVSVSPPRGCG